MLYNLTVDIYMAYVRMQGGSDISQCLEVLYQQPIAKG